MLEFNGYGFILMVLILIPNLLLLLRHKEAFENKRESKWLERGEQLGRFGSFTFMLFNVPYVCRGFWFENGLFVYLIMNGVLVMAYCALWAILWKRPGVVRAITLSVLPSLIFLGSGVLLLNLPLLVAAALFAPCHIALSYQNATA